MKQTCTLSHISNSFKFEALKLKTENQRQTISPTWHFGNYLEEGLMYSSLTLPSLILPNLTKPNLSPIHSFNFGLFP